MLATPFVNQSKPALVNQVPKKIVVLGDSLVYGFGDPEGGGWVERLRRRWMAPDTPGHVVYNLGVRGDGVAHVNRRLETEFRYRGELRNRVPDLIILSVGVNDSPRVGKPKGRPLTEFDLWQAQLAELLDQAQQLCPVLFVGMAPVDETVMPFAEVLHYSIADQQRYNTAIQLACEARQIPFLNILEQWLQLGDDWWRSRLSADGLHPNVYGYRTLLEDVLNWPAFAQAIS